MKIVITGAKGQLGNAIRECAIDFPGLNIIYTDIEELDICDPSATDNFLLQQKPAVVINCAAYTAVDRAEKEQVIADAVNHLAVVNLISGCKKSGARLIHISTDYLFDGNKSQPYTEKDIVRPRSVYGITKLAAETAILRSEVKAIIIRTSWLYSGVGNNFVKTMLRLGTERKYIDVVADQTGTPTWACDLAGVILQIVSKTEADSHCFVPGIYHYSNEGVTSWYDFAKAIFEYSPEIDCEVRATDTLHYHTPATRPAYSVLNKSKIKTTFGIEIPYWRDSLKKCLTKLRQDAKQ